MGINSPNKNKNALEELMRPYPNDALKAHTVGRLRGKNYVGNTPEVTEWVNYPELAY